MIREREELKKVSEAYEDVVNELQSHEWEKASPQQKIAWYNQQISKKKKELQTVAPGGRKNELVKQIKNYQEKMKNL